MSSTASVAGGTGREESSRKSSVPLRHVVVPTEHGSWGFLLEPVVLGLAIRPGIAGVLIGLGALGIFLARHPLRLVAQDVSKGRRYARTGVAAGIGVAFLAIGSALCVAGCWMGGVVPLVVLAAASPLVLVQAFHDFRSDSRSIVAEICGSAASGALASAIVLAAGGSWTMALSLWLFMAGRSISSVLYVRSRLRLEKGQSTALAAPLGASAAAFVIALAMFLTGIAPLLPAVAMLILLVRATAGLSGRRRALRASAIGIQEVLWGVVTVLLLTSAYH